MANIRLKDLIVGLLLIVSLFACSDKEHGEDPRLSTPENAYNLWLESSIKGDIATSLHCLTEESVKLMDLQADRRATFMDRLELQAKFFKGLKISDTKYKGEKAVIFLKGPQGDTIVVPFKKDVEGWKVDLIAMFNM